ncbi:hypothetical protein G3I31_25965 [Streptomyces sp. SID9913]|uniref:hypothetical protein n=1 Tax=Streptomyces sp. SID9913 TaxID=2706117 RepID=UPI0013DCF91E|nr:hypothetical protein [Streptomyces sp. SID9913]MBM7089515.1 hypothetical protein [Streptomyces sp. S12]NED21467.1 hypothetical protein [Streptomyces sp. SID9913]
MAVPPHWLGEPPAEQAPLTGWALSRLASAVAEDVRLDAVVDVTSTARAVEADLGGPFGARAAGSPATGRPGEAQTFRLTDVSTRGLREEDASEPWAVLFDPARLIRGIGTVTDARRDGDAVELALSPHPLFADPADAWLPPGARSLVVRLDPATGLLRSAVLHDDEGPLATARVREVHIDDVRSEESAGQVLARMARTLVEPARLTAEVAVETDPHEDLSFTLEPTALPSARSWTVTVGRETVRMSGDYAPDRTGPLAARLAELLAPARIVSHLTHAMPGPGTSVRSGVRPLRTFPFSAWAPDDSLTCTFAVDPDTGVLLRAEATASGHSVFRHTVTGVHTQAGR